MLNWKLLNKIIGSLLMIEAMLMLVCSIMSLCYGESDTLPFISSTAITAAGGVACRLVGRGADNNLRRKEAYFLVTATWFTWTAVMLLPKMHERYTFMIDILLVLLSFTNKRFVKYAAISLAINTWIYYYFFTGPLFPPLYTKIARSVIYSAAYLFFTCSLVHASKPQESHSN